MGTNMLFFLLFFFVGGISLYKAMFHFLEYLKPGPGIGLDRILLPGGIVGRGFLVKSNDAQTMYRISTDIPRHSKGLAYCTYIGVAAMGGKYFLHRAFRIRVRCMG